MKLKNVKVGLRVELKADHPWVTELPKGTTGTILEYDDTPWVRWDVGAHHHLSDGGSADGINRNYAVSLERIRRIKE